MCFTCKTGFGHSICTIEVTNKCLRTFAFEVGINENEI